MGEYKNIFNQVQVQGPIEWGVDNDSNMSSERTESAGFNTWLGWFGNAQLGTLFPPEKDATGNTSTYYNASDYDSITFQEKRGSTPSTITSSTIATLDYSLADTVTFKRPPGNVTLNITNISDTEGVTAHIKVFILQSANSANTGIVGNITFNGNSVQQFNYSGANTATLTANTLNTFDIKAVYLDNYWEATCIVG